MPAFEQLATDFVHAADKKRCLRLLFRIGQIGLQQAVLNLQGITPLLQTDIQVPLADQRRQIVGLDLENLLECLQRFFIAFGSFEIFAQFQQHLDIAIIHPMGMLVEPDRFGEILLGPIDIAQPEERVDAIGVDRQSLLKEVDGLHGAFGHERMSAVTV